MLTHGVFQLTNSNLLCVDYVIDQVQITDLIVETDYHDYHIQKHCNLQKYNHVE